MQRRVQFPSSSADMKLMDGGQRPAPGWYADPSDPSSWRWWDGARWTVHVRRQPLQESVTQELHEDPTAPYVPGWGRARPHVAERPRAVVSPVATSVAPRRRGFGRLATLAVAALAVSVAGLLVVRVLSPSPTVSTAVEPLRSPAASAQPSDAVESEVVRGAGSSMAGSVGRPPETSPWEPQQTDNGRASTAPTARPTESAPSESEADPSSVVSVPVDTMCARGIQLSADTLNGLLDAYYTGVAMGVPNGRLIRLQAQKVLDLSVSSEDQRVGVLAADVAEEAMALGRRLITWRKTNFDPLSSAGDLNRATDRLEARCSALLD